MPTGFDVTWKVVFITDAGHGIGTALPRCAPRAVRLRTTCSRPTPSFPPNRDPRGGRERCVGRAPMLQKPPTTPQPDCAPGSLLRGLLAMIGCRRTTCRLLARRAEPTGRHRRCGLHAEVPLVALLHERISGSRRQGFSLMRRRQAMVWPPIQRTRLSWQTPFYRIRPRTVCNPPMRVRGQPLPHAGLKHLDAGRTHGGDCGAHR